jgi:starch synthase (maltosyl-transferring)
MEPTSRKIDRARPDERFPDTGRSRAVIEGVTPELDCGRFPIKRIVGDIVVIEADIFTDGHDSLSADLLYRFEQESKWTRVAFEPLVNDRWRAEFPVERVGRYQYTIVAWVDHLKTWRRDFDARVAAGQHSLIDIKIGAGYIAEYADRAVGADTATLSNWARELNDADDLEAATTSALDDGRLATASSYPDERFQTRYGHELEIVVDRERARYSAWYELFPRSTGSDGAHGSFQDVERLLPYVAKMGFDVLYLPPIHPIGRSFRKGKNNSVIAAAGDTGSPWAIGAEEGGHQSILPALGTFDDFRHLVGAAAGHGLEIALDIAFQTSPDHPYVAEHPEWFRWRPDGTVQYAENPPKKYQDIYPFEFETGAWRELWQELRNVFVFWVEQGVRIFRVDNPHTKPFAFWEWLIRSLKDNYPDLIFLSESFTRPKVMYRLAKLGFSQSYTYFAWRNAGWEIKEYLSEITKPPLSDYFRPNLWPNTPDILTEYLQSGRRQAFITRFILAATLAASYGIYGPAFELLEHVPVEPGKEEYRDSEKYQLRQWDLNQTDSLQDLIAQVNRIRRDNVELKDNRNLHFHMIDNPDMIAYSKADDACENVMLTIVNLDPYHVHSGWLDLDLARLGIDESRPFQVHDLLTDERYLWSGRRNFVQLSPYSIPAHIFKIRRHVRSEHDFDYFV